MWELTFHWCTGFMMSDGSSDPLATVHYVLGHEIIKLGMDVIVHFTCRDTNRAGMESRALQLAMMGMKNIYDAI